MRQFHQEIARFNFKAKGSGKSGLIAISHPGPEILTRTACQITSKGIVARFEVGFPANGRTINSGELIKILFDFLPRCARQVFFYKSRPAGEVAAVADFGRGPVFHPPGIKTPGACLLCGGRLHSPPGERRVQQTHERGESLLYPPRSLRVTMELPHPGEASPVWGCARESA